MDSRRARPIRSALAIGCLALAVGTLVPTDSAAAARATRLALQTSSKEANSQRLNDLAAIIDNLRARLAADPGNTQTRNKLNAALAEYNSLSVSLGGDQAQPSDLLPANNSGVEGGGPGAPPNCASSTTSFTSGTVNVAIPDNNAGVATTTIGVGGVGPYVLDVNCTVNITHTFCGDIDMTLTSPAGTVITLSSDNGGGNDNVFAGTTFDDDANPAGQVPYTSNNGLVTDQLYANLTVATPLVPEEALGAFIGENANGTWTLRATDDASIDTGTIVSWSLDVTTLAAAPTNAGPFVASSGTVNVAIPDNNAGVATSTVNLAGAGTYLCDVDCTVNVTHTFNGDIDMTLTSPAGTVITLTSDNGGGNDNVYAGTTFDDDANPAGQVPFTTNNGTVTDQVYANLTVATPLTPEEALAAFVGENPNGTWTLSATDDASIDTGTIVSWSISVTTCQCTAVSLCTLTCPGDITTTAADLNGSVVTFAPTATNCINVQCTPPSGSTFPVGTTVVTCTGEDDVPGATRGTVTTTYSSGNIAVPLPDVASMPPQVINIADPGSVIDVDLRIRLNHTFDNDLDITLTGPNAVTIDVSSDNGSSGDNYGSGNNDCSGTPTVFDDEAATSITAGTAPFAGSFIPESGLSAFDGIPAAGAWTLNIADDLGGDTGTLFCYELVITRDIVVGGGGSTCQFNVNVTIPFDSCCIDDATGDVFRQVVASVPPTNPLYGYWEYQVAATSEIFAGIGNHVAYRPGLSIIIDDNDDPAVFCHAEIDFPRRKCRVQVRDITTGRNFVLRDRNINNNMCTAAPPPQS